MYILAVETTGKYCSAGLLIKEKEEFSYNEEISKEPMNHLKNLTLMMEKLISKADISMKDINGIAVSVGPGSFTGIRIGVSTARAISQTLNIPCISVNTLEAFATKLITNHESTDGIIGCPIFDARRNQIYGGAYAVNDGLVTFLEGMPWDMNDYLDKLKLKIELDEKKYQCIFAGDGIVPYSDTIKGWAETNLIDIIFSDELQSAETVAYLGYEQFKSGISCNYNDLMPNYMRIPEAQRNLEEKRKKIEG